MLLPIFDNFIRQFEEPALYEAKIILFSELIPLMKHFHIKRFLRTIDEALDYSAENSIFRHNMNPLRVGLILYKLIQDLHDAFGFSENLRSQILTKISASTAMMLSSYKDSKKLLYLIQQKDYTNHNLFWYMDEYDLFEILDCQIIDQVIQKLWNGEHVSINCDVLEYSTAYNVLMDKFKLYTSESLFMHLQREIFNFKKYKEMTHQFKFEVWKQSIGIRVKFEIATITVYTILFQYWVSAFNIDMNRAIVTIKAIN